MISTKHWSLRQIARRVLWRGRGVLFGFIVALPTVISWYLFRNRKELYSSGVYQTIGWLYEPYVRGAEFWEVHDAIMKMILTGLLICKFFFHFSDDLLFDI